jgi:hypothetical protein
VFDSWQGYRRDFSLFHFVQTGYAIYPASYPVSTRALSLVVKWPGNAADHSPLSTAKVKNVWSYTSTLPYIFSP